MNVKQTFLGVEFKQLRIAFGGLHIETATLEGAIKLRKQWGFSFSALVADSQHIVFPNNYDGSYYDPLSRNG